MLKPRKAAGVDDILSEQIKELGLKTKKMAPGDVQKNSKIKRNI